VRAARALLLGAVVALAIGGCDSLPFLPDGPVGGAELVCQGVPREACRQAADHAVGSAKVVVRVIVRCALPVCTPAEGDAEVTFQFVDETSEVARYGWTTALPSALPQEQPSPEGS
jgi:hypothetical protein